MAQKITILEYANTKGLTVYDVTQNAKEKGVILPEDPEYVLDDSQLNQIDPIFAHQNKYKQIMSGNNIDSNESAPKTLTLKNEKQPSENLRVLNKIDLSSLTFLFWLLYFDVFENACACTWEESFNLNLRCRSGSHGIANCAKTPNELPQKHQTKYHKNTKQNATKIPNALQNPQETSIFAASLYSKQYGIPQKDCR